MLKNKMKKKMKENKEEREIHKVSERDIKANTQMHTGAHCTSLHCTADLPGLRAAYRAHAFV